MMAHEPRRSDLVLLRIMVPLGLRDDFLFLMNIGRPHFGMEVKTAPGAVFIRERMREYVEAHRDLLGDEVET